MSNNRALVPSSKQKVGNTSMNQYKSSVNCQKITKREKFVSEDIVRGGQHAYKSECKVTKTVRTGGDGGYVKYCKEERIIKVKFSGEDNSKGKGKAYGGSSCSKGCNHGGCSKGCKGHGSGKK